MALLKKTLARWMPVTPGGEGPPIPAQSESETPLPAPETPQAAGAVVDPSYLRETFGDDEDLIKEILQDYIVPSQGIVGEIDAAVLAKDAVAVGKAGHKLKSSSRAIGANDLADLCFELEKAGKSGDLASIETLYSKLAPNFAAVITFIEKM